MRAPRLLCSFKKRTHHTSFRRQSCVMNMKYLAPRPLRRTFDEKRKRTRLSPNQGEEACIPRARRSRLASWSQPSPHFISSSSNGNREEVFLPAVMFMCGLGVKKREGRENESWSGSFVPYCPVPGALKRVGKFARKEIRLCLS